MMPPLNSPHFDWLKDKNAEIQSAVAKITELTNRLCELIPDVLASDPWTEQGAEVRRLARVTVKQIEMRAQCDPFVRTGAELAIDNWRKDCPELFE
jgi:hypothetical protein